MIKYISLLILFLGVMTMPAPAAAGVNDIQIRNNPDVFLHHDGVVIDQVDDGFGGLQDVYLIESVIFTNETGVTWRLEASDDQGNSWSGNITPGESGERNLPPPQRFRSFPLEFKMVLVRN